MSVVGSAYCYWFRRIKSASSVSASIVGFRCFRLGGLTGFRRFAGFHELGGMSNVGSSTFVDLVAFVRFVRSVELCTGFVGFASFVFGQFCRLRHPSGFH